VESLRKPFRVIAPYHDVRSLDLLENVFPPEKVLRKIGVRQRKERVELRVVLLAFPLARATTIRLVPTSSPSGCV
jgi:hypothetical protein